MSAKDLSERCFPLRCWLFLLFIFVVSACASQHQVLRDQEVISATNTTTRLLESRYGFIEDKSIELFLQHVVKRLSLAALSAAESNPNLIEPSQPWKVFVLDADRPGAFCAGSHTVYLTRGLISEMETESELVSVLSHEMSHSLLGHTIKALEQQSYSGGVSSSYDISQELEADRLGVELLLLARYDPRSAIKALFISYRSQGVSESTDTPKWLELRHSQLVQLLDKADLSHPVTFDSRGFRKVRLALSARR